jgi:hypothetical protein
MPQLKIGYTPSLDAKLSDNGYEISRQYVVEVSEFESEQADVELSVLNTVGIPHIDQSISSSYPTVRCTDKRCTPAISGNSGDFLTWYVDVEFKTPVDDSGEGAVNPLDEPVQFSFGSTQYEEVVEKAYGSGDPESKPRLIIQNVVGDVFDPPVQSVFSNQYVSITQNLKKFNPDWVHQYENTVNATSTRIAGISVQAKQARILAIRGQNAIDANGSEYWTVGYEIEISKRGFTKQILNSGKNKTDPSTASIYSTLPITYADTGSTGTGNEELISDPVPLTTNGDVLEGALAVYLPFDIYFPKSWSSLSIPSRI